MAYALGLFRVSLHEWRSGSRAFMDEEIARMAGAANGFEYAADAVQECTRLLENLGNAMLLAEAITAADIHASLMRQSPAACDLSTAGSHTRIPRCRA